MKEQTAAPGFLRTCVPLDDASPLQMLRTLDQVLQKSQETTSEVKVLQDQVLQKSQETTSEVKVLQDQVKTLSEVVRSIAANGGRTAQTDATSHVGSSKWASSTPLDLGREVSSMKQHVSALETVLRKHMSSEQTQASDKGRQGDDVKSAITALESRLEFRLSALQEADAQILRHCDECTRTGKDITSILDGLQADVLCRSRGSGISKTMHASATKMLASNVADLDLDLDGAVGDQSDEVDKNVSMCTTATPRTYADMLGSARGWSEEHPEEKMTDKALRVVDKAAFALVFIDLAMVGAISHIEIQNVIEHRSRQQWISFVQLFLALAFTAEFSVRCSIQRWQFFVGDGFAWNLFDFFVTSVSLVNAVLQFASGNGALGHLSFLRILRLLRLVRAAQMLRKLRALYWCRLIMDCMAHALMPTFWGFLLLVFTIYLVAAVLVQWLEVDLRGDASLDATVIELYGGLGRSMYTLFLAISGGATWHELAEPLSRRSGWFLLFFIIYVSFTTFGILNLLSAVFVSLVTRFVSQHHEEHLRDAYLADAFTMEELRNLLKKGNTREDGRISLRRVQKLLDGQGAGLMEKLNLQMEQVTGAFKMLDAEEKGSANIDELMCGIVQLKGNPEGIHISALMYENKKLLLRINWVAQIIKSGFAEIQSS